MNIENVKALVEILNKNGLSKLEICEGETKISLEKPLAVREKKTKLENTLPRVPVIDDESDEAIDFNKIKEIKAPLVGVFYSAASPDAVPFVTIGSKVQKGDPLCILEAMKLMNEITAECDGEIVDICLKDGDIAEFGQVLFKIF